MFSFIQFNWKEERKKMSKT